jgi:tRNA(Ile)-lysidine synthase
MHEKKIGFSELISAGLKEAITQSRGLVSGDADSGAEFSAKKSRIMVGLSGGPDSTALILALHQAQSVSALDLFACHVNYGLRGQESDQEQRFCEQLCLRLGVELKVVTIDLAKEQGGKFAENLLREIRYQALSQTAMQKDCPFVCVGHTLNDQIETLLFRMFRGTALAGMRGMSPARCLDGELVLLRPMLKVTRKQCLEFLTSVAVHPCFDSSNSQSHYCRNYIRNELTVQIERRFPGFESRIEQLRRSIELDDNLLGKLACDEYSKLQAATAGEKEERWHAASMRLLDPAILYRVVACALQDKDVETTFERVEKIVKLWKNGISTAISLNENWDVRIDSSGCLLWQDKRCQSTTHCDMRRHNLEEQPALIPGTTLLPSLGLALRIEDFFENACSDSQTAFPSAQDFTALVDLSRCTQPLVVRCQRPDDRIQPFGMDGSVKLKKFLHTHKKSAGLKSAAFVLADAHEVIWVPGVGLSEKLRARSRVTHRMCVFATNDEAQLLNPP